MPCFTLSTASAQEADAAAAPDIVVTADRVEEPATKTGSSITVISAAEIEKTGAKGVADVLRSVPGVDVHEAGGIGTATSVAIRGSNPGETLVLIDGVRIGDPTATDGSVDFGNLAVTDIERIEVLRGPQSALYGSDAMGGVINIITRKGTQTPRRSVSIEAGRYGTIDTRASMSGGDDRWTYAFSIDALHSDGFPRYGYRIDRPIVIGDGVTPLPPLPADDPTNKGGATARMSYRVSDDVTVETGLAAYGNMIRFDNPFADDPERRVQPLQSLDRAKFSTAIRAIIADTFGGALRNQLTIFGNVTDRNVWEAEGCFDASFNSFNCRSGYVGTRYRRGISRRLEARRFRRLDLRRAHRDGNRGHVAKSQSERRLVHSDRRAADDELRSSRSTSSRSGIASTFPMAAESIRSRTARHSRPGEPPPPIGSTRPGPNFTPASAPARKWRRSINDSANMAIRASSRSRASASTPASIRNCSAIA